MYFYAIKKGINSLCWMYYNPFLCALKTVVLNVVFSQLLPFFTHSLGALNLICSIAIFIQFISRLVSMFQTCLELYGTLLFHRDHSRNLFPTVNLLNKYYHYRTVPCSNLNHCSCCTLYTTVYGCTRRP